MTTPELITDEIVEKAVKAHRDVVSPLVCANGMRAAILAVQDDITRPVYNLLRGAKQDAEAYEQALKGILDYCETTSMSGDPVQLMASAALKGEYHKTDFTEYCEQNKIEDK